jgi:broad specificity phosphatase PhoE
MRQRKPFFAPVWAFVFAALVAVGLIAAALWTVSRATTTTVVLVRHAEKQLGTIADPPLTPVGEERAERLVKLFGDNGAFGRIDAIYVSNTRRSQQTAAPLARRLGLTPIVSAEKPAGLARQVLREHGGQRVLVVGHSNTVPALVGALAGANDVPSIADDEYGTVYVVAIPAFGASSVLRARY